MSEDLIERLRDPHLWRRDELEYIDPLAKEAAAEIERLRAKLAEAERRPDWQQVNATYEKWKARAEAAEKRLVSAKEVIAPFAAQGEELEYGEIGRTSIWEHPSAMNITFDHLRAAAEWMEKGDE